PQAEREIAPSFCSGGQRTPHRRRVQPDVLPLFPGKKEKLVFLDGAIKVPAEIIKAKFSPYRRKEGARVQLIVTDKFEDAAVITIAAASGDDIHGSAGVASVFGREVRCLDFDFLNKVDPHVVDLAVVAARVHVEAAVNRKTVVVGTISIDRCLADTQTRRQRQLILVEDDRTRD